MRSRIASTDLPELRLQEERVGRGKGNKHGHITIVQCDEVLRDRIVPGPEGLAVNNFLFMPGKIMEIKSTISIMIIEII